jgi:transcriptional regulator with XRE-family HTH domain
MNLKEIRINRKLKVQEVSDYLCCLPSVYSRYESGKREPSIDILLKLSKLYSVSVDCLIGNDEVVDTSITESEASIIRAVRRADERARQDALALLELHAMNK